MQEYLDPINAALASAQAALSDLQKNAPTLTHIAAAAALLVQTFKSGGHVYSCGNGGSMCDAMHFAEELSGKFRQERAPLPALAISDPAHLTCAANDFGFDQVFSRFITAHGRPGDVLFAISTSGSSPNVLAAATAARQRGVKVIALTGKSQGKLSALADLTICTPSATPYSDRVQELHIKVIHILIECCEKSLFAPGAA
jgi:D-sedoheptulose 7-phosphate isomerase